MINQKPIVITVCVGSSCHVKGARELIEIFKSKIKKHFLEDFVDLKGSFCLEQCGEGMNWQIDNRQISSPSVEDAEAVFQEAVVEEVKRRRISS